MKVNVLTLNSKIFIVAITLLTVSFLTASAQTAITVSTDKTSYADGDTITISGKVADQLHVPISIIIKDTAHNIAYLAQTSPGTDGTYSTQRSEERRVGKQRRSRRAAHHEGNDCTAMEPVAQLLPV